MKIAYLDCASGISGDMTLAALVDAGVPLEEIQEGIDSLGLPDCRLIRQEVMRKGFRATHVIVQHEPEHAHRHLRDITQLIDGSRLTERQQSLARDMFGRLAAAEAKVHGTTVEKVHFHEVGAVDSIADIVGCAIGWDLLGVDRVEASPVPTGRGFVEIAHGRCSIPAPATGELLQRIPLAESSVDAELTTPTGATILATLVKRFGPLPSMTIETIGYGAGSRDLPQQPNLLRLLVGQAAATAGGDTVWVVETNLDDASGEVIGHAIGKLWEAGALDVSATPIQMKKNRPGVQLTVMCDDSLRGRIEQTLFFETTTLGVRRWQVERTTLPRQRCEVDTRWGPIEGTLAELPDGNTRFSSEYEACRAIADREKISLQAVYRVAQGGQKNLGQKDKKAEDGGTADGR